MLGKLIKYEWKNLYKMGCLILGGIALITLVGWIAFQSPMWRELDTGVSSYGRMAEWLNILSGLTLILYVILLVCSYFGMTVYLVVHFYRTMYTDEGYLTHTLPVNQHQLLVSKLLVGGLWMLIVSAVMFLSIGFLGMTMLSNLFGEFELAYVWREFLDYGEDLLHLLKADYDMDLLLWLAKTGIKLLLTPFVTLSIYFGAVSIGQLFTKHRVLMAIVCYIGINTAMSVISSLIQSVTAVTIDGGFGSYMYVTADVKFAVNLIAGVALYFASWFVTSRKLNMA